ncbi:MAG: beta-ketoacyl synthase N-terminal-like domain-containing protein [Chthoniobacterales bacterium]
MMSHSPARIVITGLGTHGAGGISVPALWENTLRQNINVQERTSSSGQRYVVYTAPDPHFETKWPKIVKHADRAAKLSLAAAKQAWADACLTRSNIDPHRVGVTVGSSRGPAGCSLAAGKPHPTDAVYSAFSSIAGVVAAELAAARCAQMTSDTCISGAVALQTACLQLQSHQLDVAVVGGVDAPLVDPLLEQFAAGGVLASLTDREALRPFDQNRTGTVIGEGAAFVVVETETHARERGAHIRGVIHAVATGCEPHLRTSMSMNAQGMQQRARRALRTCEIAAHDIDLLILHGTGTRLNDSMESRCVRHSFGPVEQQPYSLGTKAITGHTLGASSIFQLLVGLESVRHGFVPATANCTTLDPDCSIRLSRGVAAELHYGLCLTSGFCGNSSCIVFGPAR